MGLLTESGLMKVAEFEKVSFDQFIQDWEEKFHKYPEESIYGSLKYPARATKGSAGHDFIAPADFVVRSGDAIIIPTGMRCKILRGWTLFIFIRSSLGIKADAWIGNGTGVIDEDYYFAQKKGLINAVDMKEYSQQQSNAQLSKIFDDLYDDLVNDIWETAQMNGRTETYRKTQSMSCDTDKSLDSCIAVLEDFMNKGYVCIVTRKYVDCTRYYYKIYISWSGHPPNVYGYVTVDDNDKEKLVFSSYLK